MQTWIVFDENTLFTLILEFKKLNNIFELVTRPHQLQSNLRSSHSQNAEHVWPEFSPSILANIGLANVKRPIKRNISVQVLTFFHSLTLAFIREYFCNPGSICCKCVTKLCTLNLFTAFKPNPYMFLLFLQIVAGSKEGS